MIELNALKFATLPNLKMRRRSRVVVSTELLNDGVTTTDDISIIKSKGPEFIVNSSRPAEQFDIVDAKVCGQMTIYFKMPLTFENNSLCSAPPNNVAASVCCC